MLKVSVGVLLISIHNTWQTLWQWLFHGATDENKDCCGEVVPEVDESDWRRWVHRVRHLLAQLHPQRGEAEGEEATTGGK